MLHLISYEKLVKVADLCLECGFLPFMVKIIGDRTHSLVTGYSFEFYQFPDLIYPALFYRMVQYKSDVEFNQSRPTSNQDTTTTAYSIYPAEVLGLKAMGNAVCDRT